MDPKMFGTLVMFGIHKRFFSKKFILKKSADNMKILKNYLACIVNHSFSGQACAGVVNKSFASN